MANHAHLSLVASKPPRERRKGASVDPRPVFRPGDRRDPTPIEVGRSTLRLAEEAAALGLDLDQAAGLLVERALALEDAASLGMRAADARAALHAAADVPIRLPLPPSVSRYLRSLIARRPIAPQAELQGGRYLALPIRLLPRASTLELAQVLDPQDLDEAIRFESAATSSGRTMTEWALLVYAAER